MVVAGLRGASSLWSSGSVQEEMSTPLLDLYTVKGNTIHGEIIATEARLQEAWWSSHRARKDRKLALALGAVPDKEPIKEPDVPKLALGKAATRPLEKTFGLTSSSREADIESTSSELRDWLRDSGREGARHSEPTGTLSPLVWVGLVGSCWVVIGAHDSRASP